MPVPVNGKTVCLLRLEPIPFGRSGTAARTQDVVGLINLATKKSSSFFSVALMEFTQARFDALELMLNHIDF